MFSLIVLFMILLCGSAFFSASETALFSLSGIWIHRFRESKTISSAKLVKALGEPRKILVTILLGNEFVNVSISIVGAAIISRLIVGSVEMQTVAAVVFITPVILIAGEILPKNIAMRYASQLAPVFIWPLSLFYNVVRPFRSLLTKIADRVIVFLGGKPHLASPMIMEEEFRKLIDLGRKEGVIVEEEREIIHNVFEFTDKVAGQIMTPAENVFSLSVNLPYEKMLEEIRAVQFSRVPFYGDKTKNVVGILHVRDLFAFHRKRLAGEDLKVETLFHPPLFVDIKTPLEVLLGEFQKTQAHMAVVQSTEDAFRGIVTMGDVLEELFGEME